MQSISGKARGARCFGPSAAIATIAITALFNSCSGDEPTTAPTNQEPGTPATGSIKHIPTYAMLGAFAGGPTTGEMEFTLNASGCLIWGNRIAVFPDGTSASDESALLVFPDGSSLDWSTPSTVDYVDITRLGDPDIQREASECATGSGALKVVLIIPT